MGVGFDDCSSRLVARLQNCKTDFGPRLFESNWDLPISGEKMRSYLQLVRWTAE